MGVISNGEPDDAKVKALIYELMKERMVRPLLLTATFLFYLTTSSHAAGQNSIFRLKIILNHLMCMKQSYLRPLFSFTMCVGVAIVGTGDAQCGETLLLFCCF